MLSGCSNEVGVSQDVYQGIAPRSDAGYFRLPWRMGLLTQTNSLLTA
ncbi:hypothetical protein [Streptomyces sp. SD31]